MGAFFLAALLGVASYPLFDARTAMETRDLDYGVRTAFGSGYVREGDGIVCENPDRKSVRGAYWGYVAAGDGMQPFTFSAESLAERMDTRSTSSDYAVYVDLAFRDGTRTYGLNAPFEPDPALGWQRKSVKVVPDKPLKRAHCYLLFRNHAGKAHFRSPQLSVVQSCGVAQLDACLVDAKRAVPLTKPGFLIRDAAAGGDFRQAADGDRRENVLFKVREHRVGSSAYFDVAMRDMSGADRAVTLLYAIPFPPNADVTWYGGPRSSESLAGARGERRATTSVMAGEGRLSKWPFAAVSVNGRGYALGLDPSAPAFFRAAYSADLGVLYIAFDIGFAPEHPDARFRFVAFDFPAEHGFRGALAAYQKVFPQFAEVRLRRHGLWMPFDKISSVRGWEDFGFAVKEGDNEPEWDRAHGIVTFNYTEPSSWWMAMAKGGNATFAECLAEANRRADAGDARALAWRVSACHDRRGNVVGAVRDTPWCKGMLWIVSPLPGLNGGDYEFKLGKLKENVGGEYIDSAEFYAAPPLDFRREHFAAAKTPLAFDPDTKRPAVALCLATFEYVRDAANRCHAIGRYLMGNCIPHSWPWLVPYSDFGGNEVKWIDAQGRWLPASHDYLLYLRAMSGGKPYCFLMNVDFTKFTHGHSERYMQLCLAYGLFAGFFSPNASGSRYFSNPELYERDRDLFKKYVPLCRMASEAGWRPVNGLAVSETEGVFVEQFGDRYLTVYNTEKETRRLRLRLMSAGSGAVSARELVAGGEWRFAGGVATVDVPPETVRMLSFPR